MLRIKKSGVAGFTLIEMVITLLIVSLLMVTATPYFRAFIGSQQLKSASFDLITSLAYARNEALKYSTGTVRVVANENGWASGWTVERYVSGSSVSVLRKREGASRLAISASSSATYIEYKRTGRATTAVTLALTVSGDSSIQGRCVTVDASGNPSSKLTPSGGC